jgi:methionyl-tRNA formyltransferase
LVRATTKPYPGAFILEDNKKVIIWEGIKDKEINGMKIICKDGIFTATKIEILEI